MPKLLEELEIETLLSSTIKKLKYSQLSLYSLRILKIGNGVEPPDKAIDIFFLFLESVFKELYKNSAENESNSFSFNILLKIIFHFYEQILYILINLVPYQCEDLLKASTY